MLVQEGSQHFQRFPRRSHFTQGSENKDTTGCKQLDDEQPDFCPFEEDTEQTTLPDSPSTDVSPAAPLSSYMPQRGGYRPQ